MLYARHQLHLAAKAIAERNAQLGRRADSAADIVMALIVGIVGAVAAMHAAGWLL